MICYYVKVEANGRLIDLLLNSENSFEKTIIFKYFLFNLKIHFTNSRIVAHN